jgi:hypothetical protein
MPGEGGWAGAGEYIGRAAPTRENEMPGSAMAGETLARLKREEGNTRRTPRAVFPLTEGRRWLNSSTFL